MNITRKRYKSTQFNNYIDFQIKSNHIVLEIVKEAITFEKLIELEVVVATTWCTALSSEV
jgi:hypothetical protein